MKFIQLPTSEKWQKILERPLLEKENLYDLVENVFNDIKANGDKAVSRYSKMYDKVSIENFRLSNEEISQASDQVSKDLKEAIEVAKANIENFHISQLVKYPKIETTKGVNCWTETRAIEKVGIYIPGGSAPLFSTVLMLGIPAKIAGCKEIILCTPPDSEGNINPIITYTAQLIGIKNIFKVGGIQAIAAMTFGTQSIPKVDKLFGPGNQYVTQAKVIAQNYGIAIDMPAGPSELLVIADQTSIPEFVASDLLSQAEHGEDSQVILLSDNKMVVENILQQLELQLETLPRKEIAQNALQNSRAVLLKNIEECIQFSNLYAPEHLILAIHNANLLSSKITNAGSLFIGNYSCESAGDYASGTNHTLPTNGFARNYSGISVDSFVKKIFLQELSPDGIKNLGKTIEIMAEAEQLLAHKRAVSIRLEYLNRVKSEK